MIPLRDDIPSRTVPFVNLGIIGICSVVFLLQLAAAQIPEAQIAERLGMVPARLMHPNQPLVVEQPVRVQNSIVMQRHPVPPAAVPDWLTCLTCIFLHGGWLHLIGNMWFLYVFGDNVEDRLGHLGYALFYLGAGVFASLSHLFFNLDSPIPTVGASGAIAGVMGAYCLLYPRAQVLTLVPLFVIFFTAILPAPTFLGIWFLLQFVQGTASLGSATTGVAWWAHIGGFALGFGVAAFLVWVGEARAPVTERRFANRPQGWHRSGWIDPPRRMR